MSALKTEVAIINDREDREQLAARGVAMRWGTGVGAVVSAVISGVIGSLRGQ